MTDPALNALTPLPQVWEPHCMDLRRTFQADASERTSFDMLGGAGACFQVHDRGRASHGVRLFRRLSLVVCLIGGAILLGGCAAVTNPVANGIPARLLPDELMAENKEATEPIPWTWLRRRPDEVYRLDSGDILGVFIEGVLGSDDQLPPINFPDVANQPPSVGFPIPIQEDGTVPLPLISPVNLKGLSISEARSKIVKAYTVEKKILIEDEARILVTLIRGRQARVQVIREDSGQARGFVPGYGFGGPSPLLQDRGQGSGNIVELPVADSDVLNVLTRTGGLPGPDAANEVVILRGYSGELTSHSVSQVVTSGGAGNADKPSDVAGPGLVRIPLRIPRGQTAQPFKPSDIVLHDGDIVYIPALDAQVYYTGGILPPREIPLPRDYDINAVEAVLRGGGPLVSGAINTSSFGGTLLGPSLGNPNPSLLTILRRTPDGRQINIRVDLNQALRDPRENLLVQAGDVLILQETPSEAVARYISRAFNFSFVGRAIEAQDGTGTASVNLP